MNELNTETMSKINEEAVLNTLMYLPFDVDNKVPIKDIVASIEKKSSDLNSDQMRQLEVVKAAIKNNPNMENMIIGNQSNEMGYNTQGLNACTFSDTDGNVTVVFRGTGSGEWIDNGEGLSGVPEANTYNTYDSNGNITSSNTVTEYATDQQSQALNYFNQIAAEEGWTSGNNISITGHSKGGNKAQFVTINSELVDNCYSFDGQGFSPEAIEQFKAMYGADYKDRIEKMYSFAADNDYVNVLGERLVPEENIYYFEAPIGDEDSMKYHFADAILSMDGSLNIQTEQGELSKYITELSREIMLMDPETRQFVTKGIMGVLQKTLGNGVPVNGDFVSDEETDLGIFIAIVPALTDLLGTVDGIKTIGLLLNSYGDEIGEKIIEFYYNIAINNGPLVLGGAIALTLVGLAIAIPFAIGLTVFSWMINITEELIKIVAKFITEISDSLVNFIYNIANNIENWYNNNLNVGYICATQNPVIKVDTYKLTNYAQRLQNVNKRIKVLDARFDTLYTKSGLLDLFNLIQADLLTGYSWRLDRCVAYLNDTANDFEVAERNIQSAI